MPRTYDPEFRRRVVELVRAGRPVRPTLRSRVGGFERAAVWFLLASLHG